MTSGTNILQSLISDKKLLRCSRLYFAWRALYGSKIHANDFAPDGFSRYQLQRYKKELKEYGWIGEDRFGNVYLRSIRKMYGYGIKVPDHVLSSNQSWMGWVEGTAIKKYALALTGGKRTKRNARMFQAGCISSASKNRGRVILTDNRKKPISVDTRRCMGLSLENIMKSFRVSKATASRMRKRGQSSGYILARMFYPVGVWRGGNFSLLRLAENGHKLSISGCTIYEEGPSQIIIQ